MKIKLTEVKELSDAGYEISGELRSKVDAPVARVKLLNQEVVTIYEKEAAKTSYDPRNFEHEGVTSKLIHLILLGEEGVQILDREQYHHRKNYFMDLTTPERMTNYHDLLEQNLSHEPDKQPGILELLSLTKNVLFKMICERSGINPTPLSQLEISELVDFIKLLYSAGPSPPLSPI